MTAQPLTMWAVKTPSGGIDPYSVSLFMADARMAHVSGPGGTERLFRGESYDVIRVTVSEVQE